MSFSATGTLPIETLRSSFTTGSASRSQRLRLRLLLACEAEEAQAQGLRRPGIDAARRECRCPDRAKPLGMLPVVLPGAAIELHAAKRCWGLEPLSMRCGTRYRRIRWLDLLRMRYPEESLRAPVAWRRTARQVVAQLLRIHRPSAGGGEACREWDRLEHAAKGAFQPIEYSYLCLNPSSELYLVGDEDGRRVASRRGHAQMHDDAGCEV